MRLFPEHTKLCDFRLFSRLGPRQRLWASGGRKCLLLSARDCHCREQCWRASDRPALRADARGDARASQTPRDCGRSDDSEAVVEDRLPAHLSLLISAQGHCEVQGVSPKIKRELVKRGLASFFCEGPAIHHFRLCGPDGLHCND